MFFYIGLKLFVKDNNRGYFNYKLECKFDTLKLFFPLIYRCIIDFKKGTKKRGCLFEQPL